MRRFRRRLARWKRTLTPPWMHPPHDDLAGPAGRPRLGIQGPSPVGRRARDHERADPAHIVTGDDW